MKLRDFPSARRERGSALIVAVFVVAILATLIGFALDYTTTTAIAARRGRDYTVAQAIANGGLETAYKRWQVYMSKIQSVSNKKSVTTKAVFSGLLDPLRAQINTACTGTGYQLTELTITPVDRSDTEQTAGQESAFGTSGPMANVPGWSAKHYSYKATAVVTKTGFTAASAGAANQLVVSVSRYFQQADASLFQAMLFFQDDLELHPGPAMTLYGLVHTNSNMYLAAGSGGSLTFASNVSYHGSQSTLNPASNYKYLDSNGYVEGVTKTLYNFESGSWGTYKAPVYQDSRNGQLSNVQALHPLGTDEASAVDPSNANASGTHEIIERPVPVSKTDPNPNASVPDPDAFTAHRVYNSAGLRVFINHKTAYSTTASDGSTVNSMVHVYVPDPSATNTTGEKSIELPASSPIVKAINAAITPDTSTGDIYDQREARQISANTIDMSKLVTPLNTYTDSSGTPFNGVLYVTDIANADGNGNTSNTDAVRIKKGGTLPDNGLTLVTDGAVYVQGDFNTGTTYDAATDAITKQPVSNTGADPTKYTVDGYTQKPAAIMGDAVMILSNSWNDANSSLAMSTRVATPTTFNAAIVSGAVLTTDSAASGGAHNFPRFLENWSAMNFTYHGSMCELYTSKLFTYPYGRSNVYSPPNRRWFFDNAFLTAPPPGNLITTTFTRGRWVHNAN